MQIAPQYNKPQSPLIVRDLFVLTAVACLLASSAAVAGTDNTFGPIVTWIQSNLTGSLGKVFALGSFGVGVAISMATQKVWGALIGVVVALLCAFGPAILVSFFTAAV